MSFGFIPATVPASPGGRPADPARMTTVGRSDRRMHRALEALDTSYGTAFAGERLNVGRLVAGGVDDAVRASLAATHERCLAVARSAADRAGGPGWMARAGADAASLSARLWAEHGEPLTAVRYDDLIRS
jgi:hypothetical protein